MSRGGKVLVVVLVLVLVVGPVVYYATQPATPAAAAALAAPARVVVGTNEDGSPVYGAGTAGDKAGKAPVTS